MNNKKESKRSKPKQQEKYLSPLPKRFINQVDYNPMNLSDLSPFRPVYGSNQTPHNVHFSNTELTIIETPANTFPRVSYLEQIDEGHQPISGIINWERSFQDESENQQDFSDMIQMSQEESKADNSKSDDDQNPKNYDKKINSSIRTAQPKQKRGQSNKKSTQTSTLSTGVKKVTCNCKKTKCLKLYCDCFRINQSCDGCNCVGCHNLSEYEEERNNAMLSLMDRNPEAFKPKIEEQQHAKGCHCKKSGCQKKYCQCFQAGLKCGVHCKCEQCKNKTDQNEEEEGDLGGNRPLTVPFQLPVSLEPKEKVQAEKQKRPVRIIKQRKIEQYAIEA